MIRVYFPLTRQTLFQLSTNLLNTPTPSKPLAPTPPNSYKMFFKIVTHSASTSAMLSVGTRYASSASVGHLTSAQLNIDHPAQPAQNRLVQLPPVPLVVHWQPFDHGILLPPPPLPTQTGLVLRYGFGSAKSPFAFAAFRNPLSLTPPTSRPRFSTATA